MSWTLIYLLGLSVVAFVMIVAAIDFLRTKRQGKRFATNLWCAMVVLAMVLPLGTYLAHQHRHRFVRLAPTAWLVTWAFAGDTLVSGQATHELLRRHQAATLPTPTLDRIATESARVLKANAKHQLDSRVARLVVVAAMNQQASRSPAEQLLGELFTIGVYHRAVAHPHTTIPLDARVNLDRLTPPQDLGDLVPQAAWIPATASPEWKTLSPGKPAEFTAEFPPIDQLGRTELPWRFQVRLTRPGDNSALMTAPTGSSSILIVPESTPIVQIQHAPPSHELAELLDSILNQTTPQPTTRTSRGIEPISRWTVGGLFQVQLVQPDGTRDTLPTSLYLRMGLLDHEIRQQFRTILPDGDARRLIRIVLTPQPQRAELTTTWPSVWDGNPLEVEIRHSLR